MPFQSFDRFYILLELVLVQYLDGHESNKVTIGIYANVKYNKP